ncbi:MAG: VWA domain-containing protein [Deferrisomatales bacterium]|nr:VWA domain-containing protein [Deferrisomatales bacterium]
MTKLKEFTMSTARPLPVIVLADVSGSMSANGKIDALNDAVSEMVTTFAEEDDSRAEIHVSVIAFGRGGASIHTSLRPARETLWVPMEASGRTPMGEAFDLVRTMVEDRNTIPSRAYRPTLVLVSDGVPTDDWRGPLAELLKSERASKATRFAMGIGADADHETLTAFLANDEGRVFGAHEAREIKNFFRWVTMSVATRSRSTNPNSVVMVEPTDLDDFDF